VQTAIGKRKASAMQPGHVTEEESSPAQQAAKAWSQYYESTNWRCNASPFGAHYWVIDESRCGVCKYCGEKRQFGKPVPPAYHGTRHITLGPGRSSVDGLRELLPDYTRRPGWGAT